MSEVIDCKVMDVKQAQAVDLNNYKVIGFGSGIYFGQHEPALMSFVEKLGNTKQDVFIFSSRGNPFAGTKYHKAINTILEQKGRSIIGGFSCKGYDCTGPYVIGGGGNKGRPNEADIKNAKRWIKKILSDYAVEYDLYPLVTGRKRLVKNSPNTYYVKHDNKNIKLVGDYVTVNHDLCIGCENCVHSCPCHVYAIENSKSIPVFEHICIQCRICENKCPHHAIAIHGTWISGIKAVFQDRK